MIALPAKFFVGAYAASPSLHNPWDPKTESDFMAGLREMGAIAGLELGFYGDLHRHDTDWFLTELKPTWNFVLTCIPGTMENLKVDPAQGLASESVTGRQGALAFARRAQEAVLRLNTFMGRKAVLAVVVHSAPKRSGGDETGAAKHFSNSLKELRSWDWSGAELWVEHCDSPKPPRAPAKGFLTLEAEIAALKNCGEGRTPLGQVINWGRSVLEERDPEAAIRHIKAARAAGFLKGLMFSGCTLADPLYGDWADSHAPFWSADDLKVGVPTSLMTLARTSAAIGAAGRLPCLGLKIQPLPAKLDTSLRLARIEASLRLMEQADESAWE